MFAYRSDMRLYGNIPSSSCLYTLPQCLHLYRLHFITSKYFAPRQIGDLIEVLSFYILRFEEAFCVGAGNAVHIDVAAAQKRQVAVSHIQLKAR